LIRSAQLHPANSSASPTESPGQLRPLLNSSPIATVSPSSAACAGRGLGPVTHVFDFAPDCLPDSSTPQPAIAVATVAAIAPTRCALAYSNVLLTASTGVAPPSIASKIARSVAPLIASARDRADALTNPSVSASS